LAGGRLVVASSDGLIRSFDPTSGALLSSVELPNGAASAPAIAGGVLYVVTKDGKLRAFR
ncbi:MAG: PQQ-binding-like beta-propeller repeat protein, partial [Rhodobacteraceae bacterium]|nr:PQQ-binding-like beta-propeller repeat protein [Paracoccaceae bacterium]